MKNGFMAAGSDFLTIAGHWVEHHPKRVMGAVAAALLLGGGGAYAVASAVVSLGPDAEQLPVREVREAVSPLALEPQSEALDLHRFRLFRSDITRSTDTADTLLKRLGINDPAAAAFLRADDNVQKTLLGRVGRSVTAEATDTNTLLKLSARWSPEDDGRFTRLVIEKQGATFVSKLETAPLTASTRIASGVIRTSLFAATDDARIPDAIAIQVAEIFSGDIDFHRSLRKGDRFSVVYETLEGDGEPLRAGRVLSAEFVNGGKTYQAMWFQEPDTHAALPQEQGRATHNLTRGGYYTLDGQSLRRTYLASPLEFSRVTSGFKMRFHPILQQWRAHLGVDYAAPTGTPVRSVGDGVVEFAGVQNGFGNVVFIKHRNSHTTVYAHLSRISVKRGQTVNQGQNIGATGATGWATGPHLHFEFRVNGQHQDPLTIARQSETIPVSAAAKPLFLRSASAVRQQLLAAASLQQGASQ
ncbi:peptidoglycan DD-metalloendopeptidase family protein [Curvibacter delicatus]|uniref:M23 family metallopeptidase n=1 Tax=Curvibacter delicatus TaxID=80879 RepID=UPI003F6FE7B3